MRVTRVFPVAPSSQEIDNATDALIAQLCPPIKGWERTVQKGGVMAHGSVAWQRTTEQFQDCAVAFMYITCAEDDACAVTWSFNFTGWLAEWCPRDKAYYSWPGSFISNFSDLKAARVALRELAEKRRLQRGF